MQTSVLTFKNTHLFVYRHLEIQLNKFKSEKMRKAEIMVREHEPN